MNKDWTGRIILDRDWALFAGAGGVTPIHRHLAFKIVVGLDRPIRIVDAVGREREAQVLAVPAGEDHQVFAESTRVAITYFDAGVFRRSVLPTDVELRALLPIYRAVDCGDRAAIRALGVQYRALRSKILQCRVNRAADLLRAHDTNNIDFVASQIGLSSSRLRHLFTHQVGGAPASYRKWRRLWKAAVLLGRGEKIVDAALEAGFSDSSHLNRTFVEMLSVTPRMFQGSEVIILSWEAG